MCLSVPAKIIELLDTKPRPRARADHEGNIVVIDVGLVDELAIGDYVMVHAGIAIDKYDPDEAIETLALHNELNRIRADLDKQDKENS